MPATDRTFLLTNDDGHEAPGLSALARAVENLGAAQVVAPSEVWSCKGHAITTGDRISWRSVRPGWFALCGTPADCVRLGIFHLSPEASWVIAGINAGANLGADIHHSGTVAAAREAVLHGRPGVAISQYIVRSRPLDWERSAQWATRALEAVFAQGWKPGTLWNINLPHPAPGSPEPEAVYCEVDPSPLPLHFRIELDSAIYAGDYHGRIRQPGLDIDVCFGGQIAISRVEVLRSDRTQSKASAY